MAGETNIGGVNLSNISDSTIQTGDISTTITAGGDVVGRDKITNHITQIKERALTVAEEAERAQQIARQRLAEAVTAYVERIGEIAADDQDALQGGPYRGLKAYTLREAEIFFGRDEAMSNLLTHLQRGRLTILHAESGAGKSSLLQAGIQYQLIVQGHVPLYLRPYNKPPAQAIKQALLPGVESLPELAGTSLREFLHQVTAVLGAQTIVVILIDQFEELFFNLSEEARQAFVGELADCLEDEVLTVRWVLALRTEFFGNLANFRPRIRNPFENDFRLNRLPAEQARVVIEEPARQVNISYEPKLIDALLADLRDPDSGEVAPAQLQLVCLALYNLLPEPQRAPDTPATLTLAMYKAEGRAEGILRGYLQRVLRNELDRRDRELARQLLIALVSSDQRRIRRTQSELATKLATYLTAAQSLDGVLNQLVDSRLLNVEEDEKSGEHAYELAHDLLLRQIEIDPETQARKAAEELLKQEVDAFKRHDTLLSRDKFDIINSQREFLVVDDDAAELLRLSQEAIEAEEREREAQRRQRTQIVFGFGVVASILAVVAGIFFFRAQDEAENARNAESTAVAEAEHAQRAETAAEAEAQRANEETEEAQRQAQISLSRQLAAQSLNELNATLPNNELALLLAIESANQSGTAEAITEIHQALSHTGRTVAILYGHSDPITSARWNNDETRILTASDDYTARVWDAETGETLLELKGHLGDVTRAIWNKDETRILTASRDDTVRIWDAETGEVLITLQGHSGNIRQATWNEKETRILTASNDKTARIWDAETGDELVVLEGHENQLKKAVWNKSETRILTASFDGTVRIWDAKTGEELLVLQGHTNFIGQAVWNQDESRILTASDDKTARIWDAETGDELLVLQGHTGWIRQAAWDQTETRILTSGADGTARMWDAKTGEELMKYTVPSVGDTASWWSLWNGDETRILTAGGYPRIWDALTGVELATLNVPINSVTEINWNADKSSILVADDHGIAWVWDVENGNEVITLAAHSKKINVAEWNNNETRVLTASDDGTARVWNVTGGTESLTLDGHKGMVWQATWNKDETRILTASFDGTARIWDAETGEELLVLQGHRDRVGWATWNKNETRILTTSYDNTARVWDAETGEELLILQGHRDRVSATWNKNETRILTFSRDNTARVWDAETGEELLVLQGRAQRLRGAKWNKDETRILTASNDGTARIWNAETGDELAILEGHVDQLTRSVWNEDETRILTASFDGTARIWDAKTGDELLILQGHTFWIRDATWNNDETLILTASHDNTARIWNAETGEELHVLSGHADEVWTAKWNKDETRILTASRDNTVKIWDAATGEELFTIPGHSGAILKASWNTDETLILTASEDGTARVFYHQLPDLLKAACHQAPRNMTIEEWERYFKGETYRLICPDLPVHPSLIERARELAKKGDIEAAVAQFEYILDLDPSLDLQPQVEARQYAAQGLVEKGESLVRNGDIQAAISVYEEAQIIDPDLELPAAAWHRLCWHGGLNQKTHLVMTACEQAVKLNPDNEFYRSGRGLNRALLGDFEGAIEDFQFAVEKRGGWASREAWLEALKAGKNPFDQETLEGLR